MDATELDDFLDPSEKATLARIVEARSQLRVPEPPPGYEARLLKNLNAQLGRQAAPAAASLFDRALAWAKDPRTWSLRVSWSVSFASLTLLVGVSTHLYLNKPDGAFSAGVHVVAENAKHEDKKNVEAWMRSLGGGAQMHVTARLGQMDQGQADKLLTEVERSLGAKPN